MIKVWADHGHYSNVAYAMERVMSSLSRQDVLSVSMIPKVNGDYDTRECVVGYIVYEDKKGEDK